jgi:hypothetical protein
MSQQPIQVRDAQNPSVVWTLDLYNNTRTMRDESGRLVTMDLGTSDVHIDSALANYAAGYKQWDGIADAVAPVVPTPKASDKYYTWDKDDVFQEAEDLIIGPGGALKEISPRLSNTSFATVPLGISSFVSTELAANADAPLKVEMAAVRRCMNAIKIGREIRVATVAQASGSWTNGYTTTLGATAKWNGGSASNPIQDIMTAIENSLTPVLGIAMSEQTYHDFFQNASVQKFVASKIDIPPLGTIDAQTYSNMAKERFSALLGLPPLLIGRSKKKTSGGYGYVWGNDVELVYNDPAVPSDGETISTFKTFRWTGADSGAPDGTIQGGFLVRSFFDPKRGARGGRVVVVAHNDIEVSTSAFAGGHIVSAHQ